MNKCPVSEICGGCDYQGIDYQQQINNKYIKVNNLLNRFCKVNDVLAMSNPYNYRNKVQVTFGYDERHNVICGNYIKDSHIIVPISECMICDEYANKIIESIKKLVIKYKISIFDERTYNGCLRHVLIRCSSKEQYMVVLVTGSTRIYKKDLFINDLIKYNNKITSVIQNVNNKRTSMILGDKNTLLYGNKYIVDELCGLSFRISPNSFYQVNKIQTEVLYNEAISAAKCKTNDIVLDAYCGTGTIGLTLASHAGKVIGVELNKHAIIDAQNNMKHNHINNVEFICSDAGKYMNKLANSNTKIDIVIMDPPRSGADKTFIKSLLKLKPKRIVYVSCNPDTLKDNLLDLTKIYKVNSIQPVDMFPYTSHIECVTSMTLK